MKIVKGIANGILAGILIVIGCSVFVALKENNKALGAILFSVALLVICIRGYSLYTGRIGFMAINHTKEDLSSLLLGLLGNVIGVTVFGLLVGLTNNTLLTNSMQVASAKLDQSFIETLIRATFCGILMYIAVVIYKENNKLVGILFCIPVFILSGFEHSIADMGYFAIANIISFKAFLYILIVILGNTIGALLIPLLEKLRK